MNAGFCVNFRSLKINVADLLHLLGKDCGVLLGGETPAFDFMRLQIHASQDSANVGCRNPVNDATPDRFVGDLPTAQALDPAVLLGAAL